MFIYVKKLKKRNGFIMRKVKCTISYDGTNFSGYQIQPNQRTIQGELEKAIATVHKGKHVRVYSSGRTDTGVHAKAQTIHFTPEGYLINVDWKRALNSLLPDDIYVHEVEFVPEDFHVRFDAIAKEYRYFVVITDEHDVFKANYTHQINDNLDLDAILAGCQYFKGTHDFTTFSSAKATVKGSKVRTLYYVDCKQDGNQFEFIFRGDGFLYNMVRILVGALIDIGRGKIKPEEIPQLIEKKDRTIVGDTAPAQGLYLWKVFYENKDEIA